MPKPAARLGDTLRHGSPLLEASAATVLIGGKPAGEGRISTRARFRTRRCPLATVHRTTLVSPPLCWTMVPGWSSSRGKPAARVGDLVTERHALIPLAPPNNIVVGEFTVLIGKGRGGCSPGKP